MPNVLEDLLLPQRAGYSRQMELLAKAMQEYSQLSSAYKQQVDTEAQQATDRTIENLAREGKLTGAALAQAHAVTNTWRAGELSKMQLQTGMAQASARQQRAELASQRNAATVSDVFNLGKFAAGAALTAGGMGAFSKPVATTVGGGAAAATGAAKGAEAAAKMADPALKAAAAATGAAKGAVRLARLPWQKSISLSAEAATKMAAPALKAAAAASRYTPWMTAVGEILMGIPGSPFTGQAMREKYPDLYKSPQYPDFSGTGNFVVSEEDLMKFLANRRRQIVGQ
jgi:hypothetical protein